MNAISWVAFPPALAAFAIIDWKPFCVASLTFGARPSRRALSRCVLARQRTNVCSTSAVLHRFVHACRCKMELEQCANKARITEDTHSARKWFIS